MRMMTRSGRRTARLGLLLTAGFLTGTLAGCPEELGPREGGPGAAPREAGAGADASISAAEKAAAEKAARATQVTALTEELVRKYGDGQRERIRQGLGQVAALWQAEDGDLGEFARAQFQVEPAALEATLGRLAAALEQLDGHYNEITRELRRPSDVDIGPQWPVDALLGSIDAGAHALDDLFASKVAFVALLNFPQTSLDQRLRQGSGWTREQWAAARLTGRFTRRVPGPVQQRIAASASAGERYINGYNIWMHHLVDGSGKRPFKKGLRLISHWNLRDEIRGDYADKDGLAKQRLISRVMQHIVQQSIPQAVIDNPRLDWNPETGAVTPAPAEEIEADAPPPRSPAGAAAGTPPGAPVEALVRPPTGSGTGEAGREPDTRYALLLDNFRAQRLADPYSPATPTLIRRSFELGREIPEERVVQLLTELCASPLARQVGERIAQRLGRKLEPHDLWYNGFLPRGRYAEAELDALTARRYPTSQAFEADIPRILTQLGFARDKAKFVAEHIRVDPSRGAGHALQAQRRGDFPRLRTRVEKTGMNYKGYNIAVHELGHNVEQVFSLYQVDHTLLSGVPNNAFTEALAFVFQQRDLELLGLGKPDAAADRLRVLHDFYSAWEIAGVALTEIAIWHFMYDHPDATPAQLREEVVRLAQKTWNRYYEPVLGGKDSPLLGIYSHMIQNTLYLPDYPLGHLIAFQIEEYLAKQPPGSLGKEFERMASYGAVTPDLWLVHATGAPLSTAPLLLATQAALAAGP